MWITHHIRKHHAKYLWLIVLSLLIGNVGGFVGGYLSHDAVKRALGGRKDNHNTILQHWLPITAQQMRLAGGAAGPIDLSGLFGPVQNQGNTNACGSFSLAADLYTLRIQRGEVPSTYFSPWFHRYNTVGATDGYTTMDSNIQAALNGGMVYHTRQEQPGQPTSVEYANAAAKDATYHVFSLGGIGTFDRIRYELSLGHPVWLLSSVNDGMWYLSPSNPYTDNAGSYHGAHFEVVVGVYGDYLKIRNSWGTGYGQGGYWYESQAGVDRTTLEAAVVTIGPKLVWPAPVKKPATHKTGPALAPLGHKTYTATTASWLRAKPQENSARVVLVGKGQTVANAGKFTAHWLRVRYHGKVGWKLRTQLR